MIDLEARGTKIGSFKQLFTEINVIGPAKIGDRFWKSAPNFDRISETFVSSNFGPRFCGK